MRIWLEACMFFTRASRRSAANEIFGFEKLDTGTASRTISRAHISAPLSTSFTSVHLCRMSATGLGLSISAIAYAILTSTASGEAKCSESSTASLKH